VTTVSITTESAYVKY